MENGNNNNNYYYSNYRSSQSEWKPATAKRRTFGFANSCTTRSSTEIRLSVKAPGPRSWKCLSSQQSTIIFSTTAPVPSVLCRACDAFVWLARVWVELGHLEGLNSNTRRILRILKTYRFTANIRHRPVYRETPKTRAEAEWKTRRRNVFHLKALKTNK